MELYCWGNATHAELGPQGYKYEQILTPRRIPWSLDSAVQQIDFNQAVTHFLTVSGKVYVCTNNNYMELVKDQDLDQDPPAKRPRMSLFQLIPELQNYVITQIACGAQHTLALTDWGQVFTWGGNQRGQLGNDTYHEKHCPKIVRALVSKMIVQIACGNWHSLVLTNCGELYAWGSNLFGQLGVQSPRDMCDSTRPMQVSTVLGIPVATIACGGDHSFLISKSGAVFGWGKNNCGQLGLNDEVNRSYPTQLKTLRTLGVRFVACGNEFSVFLTNEGGVFTCGAGAAGQLGHGTNANEMLPRMVVELMGSTISQVACGREHTLAVVPSRGRIYGFGLGTTGQLGTPQVVPGPWVSPSGSSVPQTSAANPEVPVIIHQIFPGNDHSIVITTLYADKVPPIDCRIHEPKNQILMLTAEITEQCAGFKEDAQSDLDLLHAIEQIFKNQACLNGSFLLDQDKHFACSARNYGLDLQKAQLAFDSLRKVENKSIKQVIWDNLTRLLRSLVPSPADTESMRVYLLLPLYHEFVNSKHYEVLHVRFALATFMLTENPRKVLFNWWCLTPIDYFEQMVNNFLHIVMHIISFKMGLEVIDYNQRDHQNGHRILPYNKDLEVVFRMLRTLFAVNEKREDRLNYQHFHLPDLTDYVDVQQEYLLWALSDNIRQFNICHFPFLFDASAKTALLQADQALQMQSAIANSMNNIVTLLNYGPNSQFLVLNVTRENIVQDSLRELQRYSQSDLKKPLKIKFHGEEAVDAGGVRKEFFMLLLKDLIDPKYGMFKEFADSHIVWFADVSFETENMYFLIGVLCGLAIYNFNIINLPFPLALYKKLLEKPVDLSDLREMSLAEANSMQALLDYEGDDFEKTFDLTFEITRDIFGEPETKPLKPDGGEIAVTLENRQEFVDLYVDFIFNKSVEVHYRAFHEGFMKVCSGNVMKLFQPEELMAVVTGNEEYDWQALEDNCDYKESYTSADETVQWFWEVFHDLTEADKKKFLLYLTGSDRIPIQGMKAIKIAIQPTENERCLPVAHTCFNLLDLPRYKTKERLKYKLLQAIQQTQGFSLV